MSNKDLLTGVTMLETMWKSRKMDLVDLISPFILFSIAKTTSPGEIVNQQKVLDYVRTFGFKDMPIAIVSRVIKRKGDIFRKDNKNYYLVSPLDDQIEIIEKRRLECEYRIQVLGEQLSVYFEGHLHKRSKYTPEQSFEKLQNFFSRQGLFLGTDRMEEHLSNLRKNETDYCIANYIYMKKEENAIEYDYILDLMKGYFLQSAIYLQLDNNSNTNSSYKNVCFYYDTPFVLQLLGYNTIEEETIALELHNALKRQKASFHILPQTRDEVFSILTAFQRSLNTSAASFTLEALRKNGYTSSDIDRIKSTWEKRLQIEYDITVIEPPGYALNENGEIDEKYVIDENELTEHLVKKAHWRNESAMNADIKSGLDIHKIRGRKIPTNIENAKAIFVTTNITLAVSFNQYYKQKINNAEFPLMITVADLSALTWIKCGSKVDLPEKQLLKNAYMVMQPSPEMLEKFAQVLEQMEKEGTITSEMAIAIRESRFTSKEILFASFNGEDEIGEALVKNIESKLKEEFSEQARNEERIYAKQKADEKEHKLYVRVDEQARAFADEKREAFLKKGRVVATIVFVIVFAFAVYGTIESFINSSGLRFPLIVITLFSLFSIYDTQKNKKTVVDKWLQKRANIIWDKHYTTRKQENESIIKNT